MSGKLLIRQQRLTNWVSTVAPSSVLWTWSSDAPNVLAYNAEQHRGCCTVG
jgi:hypothetical protein